MAQAISLGTSSNPGRDYQDGSGRLINCYVESRGEQGKWKTPVYAIDGLERFATLPTLDASEEEGFLLTETGFNLLTEEGDSFLLEGDPGLVTDDSAGVRLLFCVNNKAFAVAGTVLYRMPSGGGSGISLGGIAAGDSISYGVNRQGEVGIVSDGNYYTLIDGALVNRTDELFSAPNSITHINGYMVVTYSGGQWQISGVNSVTSWNTVDVTTAAYKGDQLLRAVTRGLDLLLFGATTVEFWTDVGASFPFARQAAIDVGLGAVNSVANVDQTVCWVDDNWQVRILQGYKAEIISNPYVARTIRQSSNKKNIKGYSWRRDEHVFYAITCTDFTFVFNVSTGLWHEEKTGNLDRRIISTMTECNGDILAGHYGERVIYKLGSDIYKDGAEAINLQIETPIYHNYPNPVRFKTLWIDALTGTGLANDTAPNMDPTLNLQFSRDGGETWMQSDIFDLGDINDPIVELRTDGLGTCDGNGYSFRISVNADVAKAIYGMSVDAKVLRP